MTFALVTDSTACLPAEVAARWGIHVLPVPVAASGSGARRRATTSSPSVGALAEAYRQAAWAGVLPGTESAEPMPVLALHVTAALSSTMEHAQAAARLVSANGIRVEVLDLGVSAGAMALAALAAREAGVRPGGRDGGGRADAQEALHRGAARAREVAARSKLWFMVEDLGALRRSGRLDRATAMLGASLGVCPILTADASGIHLAEAVRGRKRAEGRVVEMVLAQMGTPAKPQGRRGSRLARGTVDLVIHGQGAAMDRRVAMLREAVEEAGAEVARSFEWPIDEALSVHLGEGAWGVAVAPHLG